MPDSIFEIVAATVETVKAIPQRQVPGQAIPMPKTEAEYKNIGTDISQSLKPGERFLTKREAEARRRAIQDVRQKIQTLGIPAGDPRVVDMVRERIAELLQA